MVSLLIRLPAQGALSRHGVVVFNLRGGRMAVVLSEEFPSRGHNSYQSEIAC